MVYAALRIASVVFCHIQGKAGCVCFVVEQVKRKIPISGWLQSYDPSLMKPATQKSMLNSDTSLQSTQVTGKADIVSDALLCMWLTKHLLLSSHSSFIFVSTYLFTR